MPASRSTSDPAGVLLAAMNDALGELEVAMAGDMQVAAPIWVLGLPRSGTTLLCQLLSSGLSLGYVDNLAARFWKVPRVGARLSRILGVRGGNGSWSSEFGKTDGPGGVHEFSYFWNALLEYDGEGQYEPERAAERIDWTRVGHVVSGLEAELGRPSVHKLMAGAFFIPRFARLFPHSLFVRLKRDELDVACSLARARVHHFGRLDAWWSVYTDDFDTIRDWPYWRQIPRQVRYYGAVLDDGLAAIDGSRVVSLEYRDVCRDPRAAVAHVSRTYARSGEPSPGILADLPNEFEASHPQVDDAVRDALRAGFAELDVDGEA